MENRVLQYIKKYQMLQEGDSVAAALSGGADSVCLLHMLMVLAPIWNLRVSAIHVHHGIRETADRDEAFVKDLCGKYQIPCRVVHVNVPEEAEAAGAGIEETARRLRYEAFSKLDVQHIALAHHSMDQAETLLLNLLRGSGLRGLSGMLPVHGVYIRPLLKETPDTIRGWLKEHGYSWMEDETNQDTVYRRNKIRHELIPVLENQFNPRLVPILSSTVQLLQEDEEALMQWTAAELEHVRVQEGLDAGKLRALPAAIRKRCLRMYLQEITGLTDITQIHMEELEGLLQHQSGHRVTLPRNWEMIKEYDKIYAVSSAERSAVNPGFCRVAEVPGHVTIEPFERILEFSFVENMENYTFSEKVYTKCFDYDTITDTLEVRTRRAGDYLTMAGGRKKLKDYFIDTKIPASERDRILLLAEGSHILWVIGYRMSDACKISADTKKVLQVSCCSMNTYEGTEVHHDR